jgi:hypothetical protein
MWIDLVQRFLERTQLRIMPEALANSLETLVIERANEQYNGLPGDLKLPSSAILKSSSALLHSTLSRASKFRKTCVNSDFNLLRSK